MNYSDGSYPNTPNTTYRPCGSEDRGQERAFIRPKGLRYAETTQETVGKEYFEALTHLEHRYADVLDTGNHTSTETNPTKLLGDVIRLIQNRSTDDNTIKPFARNIIKRLQKIQAYTHKLFPYPSSKF